MEAKTIIELLERNGEDYIVTSQGWGASWQMLETDVFEKLKNKGFEIETEDIDSLKEFDKKVQDINSEISKIYGEIYLIENQSEGNVEISTRKQIISKLEKEKVEIIEERQKLVSECLININSQANDLETTLYGVELSGESGGAINIDHHNERSTEKASIEQVADILGIELSLDEQFVAANDRGFIPEMEKLGTELEISEEDVSTIIANIRMRDRQMQGITVEHEAQAEKAIEKLGELSEKQDYILIDGLQHSKSATITDRLYGKYDNLLIISLDGETNFFGSANIIKILNEKFPGGWFGGQLDQGNGFWGGYADQEEIKKAVQEEVEKIRNARKEQDKIEEDWLNQYSQDKIGTIAKLSQAMQHGAWLREWQRVHGDEPRIKPITQKVKGEKVKVGEADIAVPWSKLPEFFRLGNEYGDIETVKFLSERIESGDISDLTEKELHDLSERENVKWSDGKHSLNPFQGYLYDFTSENSYTLEPAEQGEEYGKFYPINEYRGAGESWQGLEDLMPNDSEYAVRYNQTHSAFQRYYTTRLMQQLLSSKQDSKYYEFVDFDITSVTTPEQIAELDKKLAEIVQSPEIQSELERLDGDRDFEEAFYNKLREEVAIEIKKDSDRIENAHKVYVALETGNMDELLADSETARWAREVYERETRGRAEK